MNIIGFLVLQSFKDSQFPKNKQKINFKNCKVGMQEAQSEAENSNIEGLMQLKLNDKHTNVERGVGDVSLEPQWHIQ